MKHDFYAAYLRRQNLEAENTKLRNQRAANWIANLLIFGIAVWALLLNWSN